MKIEINVPEDVIARQVAEKASKFIADIIGSYTFETHVSNVIKAEVYKLTDQIAHEELQKTDEIREAVKAEIAKKIKNRLTKLMNEDK